MYEYLIPTDEEILLTFDAQIVHTHMSHNSNNLT